MFKPPGPEKDLYFYIIFFFFNVDGTCVRVHMPCPNVENRGQLSGIISLLL